MFVYAYTYDRYDTMPAWPTLCHEISHTHAITSGEVKCIHTLGVAITFGFELGLSKQKEIKRRSNTRIPDRYIVFCVITIVNQKLNIKYFASF